MSETENEDDLKKSIEVCERINLLITSRDPVEAFRGRVARGLFDRWIEIFSDSRGIDSEDYLRVLTEISAWLVASTCMSILKHDEDCEEAFKALYVKDFAGVLSSTIEFHLALRRMKRHEDKASS